MEQLRFRRSETAARILTLQERLANANKIIRGKACVYATGSFGRGEAGSYSDLDIFIAGRTEKASDDADPTRSLRLLDEICVKAELIEVTRQLGIPDFDGDGRYLEHYTVDDLTKTLGTPEDDSTNTFTARLLLLLESQPLLEGDEYEAAIEKVVYAYWQDYEDHLKNFSPGFLVNDILRLWRTFCVNYEARTKHAESPEKKARRKVKNYKLAHSRMLTCYSAILFLLARFRTQNTVPPGDAVLMARMTPTSRLEWLLGQEDFGSAHEAVRKLLHKYDEFLKMTNIPEKELAERFLERAFWNEAKSNAYAFGDLMAQVLDEIGGNTRLHRHVIV